MAAVATLTKSHKLASGFTLYVGSIALDSSYPTGGEAVDLTFNERLDVLICENNTGYQFDWDPSTQALVVYRGDNDNAADAPGAQMANTGDLSALTTVQFIAVGQ